MSSKRDLNNVGSMELRIKIPKRTGKLVHVPQSPPSFSNSEEYTLDKSMINRFGKWVKFKDGNKKSSFLSNQKSKDFVLVLCISNQLRFYNQETFDSDPVLEFDLDGGFFFVKSSKSRKMVILAFDRAKKQKAKLKIQCVNILDFNELIRLLKESDVAERATTKGDSFVASDSSASHHTKLADFGEVEGEEDDDAASSSLDSLSDESSTIRAVAKLAKIDGWNTKDVLSWSKSVLVGTQLQTTLYESAREYIEQEQISGETILSFTDEQIEEFLVEKCRLRKLKDVQKVGRELKRMRDTGHYDPQNNTILSKVVEMMRSKSSQPVSPLCALRLSKEFGSVGKLKPRLLSILYGEEEKSKSNAHRQLPKKFNVKVNIVENLRSEDTNRKMMRKILSVLLDFKDATVPRKFVGTRPSSPLRRLVGDDEGTKFGIFHSSLSIGNLQLEWVNCELVIVRPVASEKVIVCSDVGQALIPDGDVFATRLAEEIINWNVNHRYSSFGGRRCGNDDMNCQHFVLKILSFLEINWDFPSRVKKFINSMKYTGKAEKVFRFDKKFSGRFFADVSPMKKKRTSRDQRQKEEEEEELEQEEEEKWQTLLKKVKKTKEFRPQSHKELDRFVQRCFSICPMFERDFNGEYMLLKGFDRAYWMTKKSVFGEEKGKKRNNMSIQHLAYLKRLLEPDSRKEGVFWRVSGCPFTPPKNVEI